MRIGMWMWRGCKSKWLCYKEMLRSIKICYTVKTRSCVTRENQVRHLVTLEGMSADGMMGTERGIGDHPNLMKREREKSSLREKTVSLPPYKSRREEQGGKRLKGPVPHSQVFVTSNVSSEDAMSKALHQISQSPFLEEIEKIDLSKRYTRPTFTIFYGKMDPLEHVSHYNQSMTIYSKNKALMCKILPSSLGPITMRWFNGLEKWAILGYDKLIKSFGARFVTCSKTPKQFSSLLSLAMKEGETLRAYSDRY